MPATPDPPFENQPQGISLDELAAAFAQAMGTAPPAVEPTAPVEEVKTESPGEAASQPEPPGEADDGCPIGPRSILEAMLFVGNRDGAPLPPARAAELMRGVEPGEIAGLVDELNARYEAAGCPYQIVSEGTGYRLTLRPEMHGLREKFFGKVREAKLSQAAVDVLALVAYQQPLSADKVGQLRGKPSGHVLSQLVHRGLLRIEREAPRRTAFYYTTDRFLELFGLETLDDLPRD